MTTSKSSYASTSGDYSAGNGSIYSGSSGSTEDNKTHSESSSLNTWSSDYDPATKKTSSSSSGSSSNSGWSSKSTDSSGTAYSASKTTNSYQAYASTGSSSWATHNYDKTSWNGSTDKQTKADGWSQTTVSSGGSHDWDNSSSNSGYYAWTQTNFHPAGSGSGNGTSSSTGSSTPYSYTSPPDTGSTTTPPYSWTTTIPAGNTNGGMSGSGGTGSGSTSSSGGSGGTIAQGFAINLPGANTGQMIDPSTFTVLSMGVSTVTVTQGTGSPAPTPTWTDAWNAISGKNNGDMIRWGSSKLAGAVEAAGEWTGWTPVAALAGGTSSLINSVGGMMAAAADPIGTVTNGAKSAYDTFNAASNKAGGGLYGTWFGVSAVTGIPKLAEAAYGVDIMTDEVLTPEQRVDRAIEGFGAACNVAAVVGGAGMSAATKLGFSVTCPKGNGWIANQARAQMNNKVCFVAGTPISTEDGLRPIETIRAGDKVWSFDLVGGEWHLRPVLEKFERDYSADLVHVTFAGETIQATMLHPFYVVTGKDLEERPIRSHLEPPPESARVPGRWVDATDLKPGDRLLLRDGRRIPIEQVQHVAAETTVHNFSVDQFRCYVVGTNAALVHNSHGGEEKAARPTLSSKSLTQGEVAEIQNIANKHKTTIDIVGSRAAGKGRNIYSNYPKGKGDKTRSDIDFRIDSKHPHLDELVGDLKNVGNGVGSADPQFNTNARPTRPPFIRFTPGGTAPQVFN